MSFSPTTPLSLYVMWKPNQSATLNPIYTTCNWCDATIRFGVLRQLARLMCFYASPLTPAQSNTHMTHLLHAFYPHIYHFRHCAYAILLYISFIRVQDRCGVWFFLKHHTHTEFPHMVWSTHPPNRNRTWRDDAKQH